MQFTVTKEIRVNKPTPLRGIIIVLILLMAVPVLVIAFLSLLLYMAGNWIVTSFAGERSSSALEPYFLERPFLENEHVKITVVEDERDEELTELNAEWNRDVYEDDDNYLFRARTTPLIPEIDDKVIGFFVKQYEEGAVLQLLSQKKDTASGIATTELVYLRYNDLQLSPIIEAGGYCLYNDEKDPAIIRGISNASGIIFRFKDKS